jgi:hypothetical protein
MKKFIFIIFAIFFIVSPDVASASGSSLALTITPPLMKLNIGPGESLATAVKVVNNNNYPITIYARTVDFTDNGSGEIKFLNLSGTTENSSAQNNFLSRWISLSQDRQELQPFQTGTFSFSIDVPLDAAPGGHYAAILIGTNPPEQAGKGTEIKVSSYISSLILLRVSGDIQEQGSVREFTFSPRVYQGGDGSFKMSFENTGNVDLAPVGDIKIFDMFGRQKGDIAVNDTSDFSGNVLPNSIRTWNNFKWSDDGLFLLNRYRAELSLSFGDQAKQTEFSTFFFWGVNWRWLLIIVGSLLLLFALLIIFVRFYISQSVKGLEKQFKAEADAVKKAVKKKISEAAKFEKNIEEKVIDLRKKK